MTETASHSQAKSVRLAELTSHDIEQGDYQIAMLPVGATEWHGPHLPYSTDTLTAEAIAVRLAQELGQALVLPPLSFGVSSHLFAWPWTISVRPETLMHTVMDVAESLLAHGITRLLVVSAHDGNPGPIDAAAQELQRRYGMTVAVLSGWQEKARELLLGSAFDIDLDHAGQSEVSMILKIAPDLVHLERARDLPRQKMDHPVQVRGPFSNVVPEGFSGAASQGTGDEGAAILDAIAGQVVPFLRELVAHGWQNGTWMSGLPAATERTR